MTKEEIEQLFENNSDCYADTREENQDTEPPILIDGKVVMAMTKDKFVEVVGKVVLGTLVQQAEYAQQSKPSVSDEEIEEIFDELCLYSSEEGLEDRACRNGAKKLRDHLLNQ